MNASIFNREHLNCLRSADAIYSWGWKLIFVQTLQGKNKRRIFPNNSCRSRFDFHKKDVQFQRKRQEKEQVDLLLCVKSVRHRALGLSSLLWAESFKTGRKVLRRFLLSFINRPRCLRGLIVVERSWVCCVVLKRRFAIALFDAVRFCHNCGTRTGTNPLTT